MTQTPIQIMESLQITAAERCANEIFLDCCHELGDADIRTQLLEVSVRGVRSGAREFATDHGLGEEIAGHFALFAAIAFELRWFRLLLGRQQGGVA